MDPSLDRFPTFWSSLFAYGILALSVAGTNQQAVQRYMACGDLRASRRAALLSWALFFLATPDRRFFLPTGLLLVGLAAIARPNAAADAFAAARSAMTAPPAAVATVAPTARVHATSEPSGGIRPPAS